VDANYLCGFNLLFEYRLTVIYLNIVLTLQKLVFNISQSCDVGIVKLIRTYICGSALGATPDCC
jgi:hypothetical protein